MMERKSLVFKAAYIYKKKQGARRTTHTHTIKSNRTVKKNTVGILRYFKDVQIGED